MLLEVYIAFLSGMVLFLYMDKKKRDAFPEEFSITRFLGLNKINPDPSISDTQSKLHQCHNIPERKLEKSRSHYLISQKKKKIQIKYRK
jgi:hypothetical protein